MKERMEELQSVKERTLRGSQPKIDKQHKAGKLTARERIDLLLDPGSFFEWNMLSGHAEGLSAEGIVTGAGKVEGRSVCVFSQDATILGGSMGHRHGYKMHRAIERALDMRIPIVGLYDSPGARVEKPDEKGSVEVMPNNDRHSGSIFYPNTQSSGVIPQISAILGSCAGAAVYSPAITDFIFMVDGISHMFITGPRIVKSAVGQAITMDELGGAKIHARITGLADLRLRSEQECFRAIKRLLSFLPLSNSEPPPFKGTGDDVNRVDEKIAELVPDIPSKVYDMHRIIERVCDNGDFLELKPEFAGEVIVCFCRMGGHTVGLIANQPMVKAGAMTVDSSDKQARFMRFCDAFNIPIVLLIDTPGYMPGSAQEHGAIIRHGAKVVYAHCESKVPRIGVILRKCYGGAQLGMGNTPGFHTDFIFYWPSAEAGLLGAKQSIELFYRDEIAAAKDPDSFRAEKVRLYSEKFGNPIHHASGNLYVEDVIHPAETRKVLIQALQFLRTKSRGDKPPRWHGNIPL
ncbi:MAG: acyl-CoA carboxylase subunit beta [Desulfobacteraceae bacterium]|nr:MAG: acyl-CoA carboxylase subunit beta [Desulfobacteraceae bacterium]